MGLIHENDLDNLLEDPNVDIKENMNVNLT